MCRMHAIGLVFLGLTACDKKEAAPAVEPVASRDVPATATATETASASATTTASALAKAPTKIGSEPPSPPRAAAGNVTGKNFMLYLASPRCHVDAACAATIKLVATGAYHINKDYPYKLVPAAGFAPDGQEFKQDAEKEGTLTVRFTPKAKGETKVAGTFKMSVCSDENCQIEQQPIALAVDVQ